MTVTDQQRRMLFDRLAATLGDEAANILTELLPFQPSSDLVTREDLAATTTMLRGEMAELRAELRGEMAELRGEFIGFKGEMKGEFYRWGMVVVAANAVGMVTALLT